MSTVETNNVTYDDTETDENVTMDKSNDDSVVQETEDRNEDAQHLMQLH